MEIKKTTVYLKTEIKDLIKKAVYLTDKTKKDIINEALEIGLMKIIKENEK